MTLDKAVFALVAALVLLSTLIVVALIFSPAFGQTAPTLIAAVLGPLTTALSILGGILASRGLSKAAEEEVQQVHKQQATSQEQQDGGQA